MPVHCVSDAKKLMPVHCVSDEFEALKASFVEQHRVQWNAFVKKIGEDTLVDALGNVVDEIRAFAMPVLRSLAAKRARG